MRSSSFAREKKRACLRQYAQIETYKIRPFARKIWIAADRMDAFAMEYSLFP